MALADHSGTIAAGGTAQTLMAADATRNGFSLENVSAGDLWINDVGGTAAASQPSIKIVSGAFYETAPGQPCQSAISIYGATTAQAFTSRSW